MLCWGATKANLVALTSACSIGRWGRCDGWLPPTALQLPIWASSFVRCKQSSHPIARLLPSRETVVGGVRQRSQSIRRSFQLVHIALIIPPSRFRLRSPVPDSAGAKPVALSPRGTARRLRSSEVRLRRRFPVLPGYLAKCERNRGARHLVACNGVTSGIDW
jgi:hypothetical protein